jgi:hypothetical protein
MKKRMFIAGLILCTICQAFGLVTNNSAGVIYSKDGHTTSMLNGIMSVTDGIVSEGDVDIEDGKLVVNHPGDDVDAIVEYINDGTNPADVRLFAGSEDPNTLGILCTNFVGVYYREGPPNEVYISQDGSGTNWIESGALWTRSGTTLTAINEGDNVRLNDGNLIFQPQTDSGTSKISFLSYPESNEVASITYQDGAGTGGITLSGDAAWTMESTAGKPLQVLSNGDGADALVWLDSTGANGGFGAIYVGSQNPLNNVTPEAEVSLFFLDDGIDSKLFISSGTDATAWHEVCVLNTNGSASLFDVDITGTLDVSGEMTLAGNLTVTNASATITSNLTVGAAIYSDVVYGYVKNGEASYGGGHISTGIFSTNTISVSVTGDICSMQWGRDGTRAYVTTMDSYIYQYDLAIPYDISIYTLAVSTNFIDPNNTGTYTLWNDDGTKFWHGGRGSREVTLSNAWEVSSIVSDTGFAPSFRNPFYFYDLKWNDDGTKLLGVGYFLDDLPSETAFFEWECAIPYDFASKTTQDAVHYEFPDGIPTGLHEITGFSISPDGTNVKLNDRETGTEYELALETAWDLGTATLVDTVVRTEHIDMINYAMSPDGSTVASVTTNGTIVQKHFGYEVKGALFAGDTTIDGTLDASGDATIAGDLSATNVTTYGDLTMPDSSSFAIGNLIIQGTHIEQTNTSEVLSIVNQGQDLYLETDGAGADVIIYSDDANISNESVDFKVIVTGTATIDGDTVVTNGDLAVSGNINQEGYAVLDTRDQLNATTGWKDGGEITINATNSSLIDISAGSAQIVSYADPPNPDITEITWDAIEAYDPGLDRRSSWVTMADNGSGVGTVVMQDAIPPTVLRTNAVLGRLLSNVGGPAVTSVLDFERPAWGLGTAFQDYVLERGSWTISGNKFTPNNSNLLLDRGKGTVNKTFRYHAEDTIGEENVHTESEAIGITSYNYHQYGNDITTNLTAIAPNLWDNAGSFDTVPDGYWTIPLVWYFPVSGTTHVVPGQAVYASKSEALIGLDTEVKNFNTDTLDGAIARTHIIVQQGTTSLEEAIFIQEPIVGLPTYGQGRVQEPSTMTDSVGDYGQADIFYNFGSYDAPSTDTTLTIGGTTTQTYGTAGKADGRHAFACFNAGGDASLTLTVSGISYDETTGTVTSNDTEVISTGIQLAHVYAETTNHWVGQITYTLTGTTGSYDFNYGFVKYDDNENQDFTVTGVDFHIFAQANASDQDIEVIHHRPENWTYAATGFVPGPSDTICDMATDYAGSTDLVANEDTHYKRTNLSTDISGSTDEGLIVRYTQTTGNAFHYCNAKINTLK